jgi:signal transduction histidine kinase
MLLFPAVNGPAQDISNTKDLAEAARHIGKWIWDTNTFDKQSCRFWKSFEIPRGAKVTNALFYITADNSYSLFLDGREIGRGSDWRTLTEYDVKWLLQPGIHVLAVDTFNDRLAGGLMFGAQIRMAKHKPLEIVSDPTWNIVPTGAENWLKSRHPGAGWHPAVVEAAAGALPWKPWPFGLVVVPPLEPLITHFWQAGWFQLFLFSLCLLALLFSSWLLLQLATQTKAERVLEIERARIARDIHDDLGAQLTQLVLLGEVAQSEQPSDSSAKAQFNQICTLARDLSHAMDEIVWTVNSRRDTLRDFVTYVCKYAQIFLNPTPIRCRLEVEPAMPPDAFDLPVRRNLFLAVKEALNNAAKYSQADELFLRIYRQGKKLFVVVEDNGCGFDLGQAGLERNGLNNMAQRMNEIGGTFNVASLPGAGCRVVFCVPLDRLRHRVWFPRRPPHGIDLPASAAEVSISENPQN